MAPSSSRGKVGIPDISFTAQVWKEGATFVAYSPELDVASCGSSLAKARTALQEAVSLFLEECARKGSLQAILSEAGFEKHGSSYRPRRILAREKLRLAVPLAS
jgi:predicted RNase H-like HicB family nuclease